MSPEQQAAAEEAAIQKEMDFSIRVIHPIIDQLKEKYKNRHIKGHMTCPKCHVKGALKVTHFLHRKQGRVRLFCETKDCIRVME